jgi:hypothetical protein
MRECRFCHAPIDPQSARAAGEFQARVNQACSDASYAATAAYAMLAFLLLDLLPIPFIPFWLAYLLAFFSVIFLVIRWQVKFGDLKTHDPDYKRALFSRNVALVLWLVAMPIWIVGRVFGAIVMALLLSGAH